jgi:hypothetical protein
LARVRVNMEKMWEPGSHGCLAPALGNFDGFQSCKASRSVNFPHLPTKSVVRYGAPQFVEGKLPELSFSRRLQKL